MTVNFWTQMKAVILILVSNKMYVFAGHGDNSSVDDTAYTSGNNFLWEDVDNYIRQQETSGGIS
jgi:hypothetical protein